MTWVALALVLTAAPASASTLQEGVIFEPASGLVVAMAEPSGIVAASARSGATRWRTRQADLPILIHGHELLAMANDGQALKLVVLELSSGKVLRRLPPLALGPHVVPAVMGQRGHAFTISAKVQGATATLDWSARSGFAGGAALTEQAWRERTHVTRGTVTLDLQKWKVTGEHHHEVDPRTYVGPVVQSVPPVFEVDGLHVSVVGLDRGQQEVITLKRSRAGKSLPDVALATVPKRKAYVLLSVDRKTVAVVLVTVHAGRPEFAMSLFRATDGTRVAQLTDHTGLSGFIVWRNRLIRLTRLEPPRVIISALHGSKPLSTIPVRDLTPHTPPLP